MSGLMRNATRARRPISAATSSMTRSSAEDSTFNIRISVASASLISSRLFPTPANTILDGGMPAFSARYNSPPETISAPLPSRAIRRRMARLELAFTAYATMCDVLKGPIEDLVMPHQRGIAIDIARRPDLFGDPADRQVLARELPVPVFKVMHPAKPLPAARALSARGPASRLRTPP